MTRVHTTYLARILLTVVGAQDTSAAAHPTPSREGMPRMSVVTGSVLTYCLSLDAVVAHAEAWTAAQNAARRTQLPVLAKQYPLSSVSRAAYTATLSQTVGGRPSFDLTVHTPFSDMGNMASLWIRVGQLTLRALDTAAIDSIAQVWKDSVPLAATLFAANHAASHM